MPVIGVPAYFSPVPLWDRMLAGVNVGMVVMNPQNGPGFTADAGYVSAIESARTKGISVYGYVVTGWGTSTNVIDDVFRYQNLYGIRNIFLDETPPDCESLSNVYRPWLDAIHASGGRIAVNPGTIPGQCWADAADVVVTFEDNFNVYVRYVSAPWMKEYSPAKFWNIVYSVPAGASELALRIAEAQRVGVLYATEDGLPNPYDSLPAGWTEVPYNPIVPPVEAPPVRAEAPDVTIVPGPAHEG